MAKIRRIVEIDEELCDGCGLCALACAEGALEIRDGKARIISDSYCDGLGACLSGCPQGAVRIIEREADEFDPEAVEEHLEKQGKTLHDSAPHGGIPAPEAAAPQGKGATLPMSGNQQGFTTGCSCPSTRVETFAKGPIGQSKPEGSGPAQTESQLSHWPVQIRLVPPTAPFLKNADLLVVSDCAPVAYPNFHHDFVKGKVVLMGCPKLDNASEYVSKFAEIFSKSDIRSITVLDMEVPCCSALPLIVQKGMKEAGKSIPLEDIVVGVRGNIVKRDRSAV